MKTDTKFLKNKKKQSALPVFGILKKTVRGTPLGLESAKGAGLSIVLCVISVQCKSLRAKNWALLAESISCDWQFGQQQVEKLTGREGAWYSVSETELVIIFLVAGLKGSLQTDS